MVSGGGLNVRMDRALGAEEMMARLKRAGWTGAQLKEHVGTLKREAYPLLDRFAGGALTEVEGTPVHAVMLELTAIRYVLGREEKDGKAPEVGARFCAHGYSGGCRECRELA